MAKGNIDAPRKSSGTKENSFLVGNAGFKHKGQPSGHGHPGAEGMSTGRGVGGAEHHKGSTFGGKTDCIRGANPKLPGGQSLK